MRPRFRLAPDIAHQLRYRPRDLWSLGRTPVGRRKLWLLLSWLAWPILGTLAAAYRRTVLRRTPVVVVVGSFGKTTTSRAIEAALGGSENRQRANSWSYLASWMLAHRPGRPLVVEVGISRRGQMRRYARALRPDVVVFTSIGREHRRSLGTVEAIGEEKAWMLRGMAPHGVAIVNGDDAQVIAATASAVGTRRVVTYGLAAQHHFWADDVALEWPSGTELTVHGPDLCHRIRVPTIGAHGVRAVLAAVAVGHEMAISVELLAPRLARFTPPAGRLEPVALPSGAILLRDDIKSGLETIHAAFECFATVPAGRRLLVLGDITEPEGSQKASYRALGARAASVASRIVYLGNHFQSVRRGARSAPAAADAVSEHADVQELAATLRGELQPGDVVLLKGRSDQKLGRVALLLSGAVVRCSLRSCRSDTPCESCAVRAPGWGTRRPVT